MSTYIKISYQTRNTNQALMKCIMYIGKYYGKNKDDLVDGGITYIAKKVGNASKRSVRFMIYSKRIEDSSMRQWRYKKKSYDDVYRYIMSKLLDSKRGNRDEACTLLCDLSAEAHSRCISDSLVSEQKVMLNWAIDKVQYKNNQKYIEEIIDTYDECDRKYDCLLKRGEYGKKI